MASRRMTWREKFQGVRPAYVKRLEKPFGGVPAGNTIYIATPAIVADAVALIPRGQSVTAADLRQRLARKADADATCAATFGLFLRIASEVALEEMADGKKPADILPFWRVIRPRDPLAQKLSCGPEFLSTMRAMEGLPA